MDVTVPPTPTVGELERPEALPPDPRTEFAVVAPVIYRTEASFIAEIDRELAARPAGARTLLLFLHGYNNTTSEALLRLAQFVEDTGFQGVPVLFTSASAARAPRCVYDLNSALVARYQIKKTSDMLSRTRAKSADLFAHSMEAFLTMEGLVDAQQAGRLGRRKTLNHIVLASPGVDIDLFRSQLALLPPEIRRKMCLLVSGDDSALRLSSRIAGGVPRVGAAQAEELEQLGLTVIDLSAIDDSPLGSHSKFARSPRWFGCSGPGSRGWAASARTTPPPSTSCWQTYRSASTGIEAHRWRLRHAWGPSAARADGPCR